MKWTPTRISNGSAVEYRAEDGTRLVQVRNHGGFFNWDVKFPNRRGCRQRTLDDAKRYADDFAPLNQQ